MNDDQELHGLYIAYDELCRQEREAELCAEMSFEKAKSDELGHVRWYEFAAGKHHALSVLKHDIQPLIAQHGGVIGDRPVRVGGAPRSRLARAARHGELHLPSLPTPSRLHPDRLRVPLRPLRSARHARDTQRRCAPGDAQHAADLLDHELDHLWDR